MADTASVELGVKFTADVDGQVPAIRFYKGPQNLGTHTGSVWTAAGDLLGTVTFTVESSTGWQTAYFSNPVDITAGTTYIVSYRAPSRRVCGDHRTVSPRPSTRRPLHTVAGGGVYTYGTGAPLDASTRELLGGRRLRRHRRGADRLRDLAGRLRDQRQRRRDRLGDVRGRRS